MLRFRVTTSSTAVAGGPWLNTYYFLGGDTQANADQARNALATFYDVVNDNQHTSVTNVLDTVVAVMSTSGQITSTLNVTAYSSAGIVGANQPLPPATQALVQWRTGVFFGGREVRGRSYIPGFTELANATGVLDSTIVTSLTTAATTLAGTTPAQLGVWSRKNAAIIDVTSAAFVTKWAVLRSRKD